MRHVKDENREVISDAGAAATGALVGLAIGGPPGSVVGAIAAPVIADFGRRMLSPKETSRVDEFEKLVADKVTYSLKHGSVLRSDLDSSEAIRARVSELFESFLLKARGTFEERKLPYLANLCARSFFTNTPIENMLIALEWAEKLSYRQYTMLSLFNPFRVNPKSNTSGLSQHSLQSVSRLIGDEYSQGIILELWDLVKSDLLMQMMEDLVTPVALVVPGSIIPGRLELGYTGRLLHIGMGLDDIPVVDRTPIIEALSKEP